MKPKKKDRRLVDVVCGRVGRIHEALIGLSHHFPVSADQANLALEEARTAMRNLSRAVRSDPLTKDLKWNRFKMERK